MPPACQAAALAHSLLAAQLRMDLAQKGCARPKVQAVEEHWEEIWEEFRRVTADPQLASKGNSIWVPAVREEALPYGGWRAGPLHPRAGRLPWAGRRRLACWCGTLALARQPTLGRAVGPPAPVRPSRGRQPTRSGAPASPSLSMAASKRGAQAGPCAVAAEQRSPNAGPMLRHCSAPSRARTPAQPALRRAAPRCVAPAPAAGPDWRTLVLQDRGIWEPTNSRLFPRTTRILQSLDGGWARLLLRRWVHCCPQLGRKSMARLERQNQSAGSVRHTLRGSRG